MKKYIGAIIIGLIIITLLIIRLTQNKILEYTEYGAIYLQKNEIEDTNLYYFYTIDGIKEYKTTKKINKELTKGKFYDILYNESAQNLTEVRDSLYVEEDKIIELNENIVLKNNIILKSTPISNLIEEKDKYIEKNIDPKEELEVYIIKKDNKIIKVYEKTNLFG